MAALSILLADNDPDFLESCAEFLEAHGFSVLKAQSPRDARQHFEDSRIHVAILDMRLTNDDDDKDVSGLAVAKDSSPAVPKIILTRHRTWEAVRDSLGTTDSNRPAASYFVAKQEGLPVLLDNVRRAFARHVRINWDLVVDWKDSDGLSLAHLLDSNATGGLLLSRAEELDDLLGTLFFDCERITVSRPIWSRNGLIALRVRALRHTGLDESCIVVCGKRSLAIHESESFLEWAPKAPGRQVTVFLKSSETGHLGASAYAVAGADLEDLRTVADLYQSGPEKLFTMGLTDLFENTLGEWHQNKRKLDEQSPIGKLYWDKLGLNQLNQDSIGDLVQSIVRKSPTIGQPIEISSGQLTIQTGSSRCSYLDPTRQVNVLRDVGEHGLVMKSPGLLAGNNVLVDARGGTYLTDFSDAGFAPIFWNYVQMEAAIRFDWLECDRLQSINEMERLLVDDEFRNLNIGEVEQPLRKPLRAIQTIRRFAVPSAGNDPVSYHVGIFFHAIRRILDSDPQHHLTPRELARLGHVVIASAMIATWVSKRVASVKEIHLEAGPSLRIDQTNRRVYVAGRALSLSRQSYELLSALNDKPDQLVLRRELGRRIFGEKYDEVDPSDINRLNQAIFRLREKIEDDPKHPRLIVTEAAGGYRLATPK